MKTQRLFWLLIGAAIGLIVVGIAQTAFADDCVVRCFPLPGGGMQCVTYCDGSPQ